MALNPSTIFQQAFDDGASDVHIVVGYPVLFRIDGILEPQAKKALTKTEVETFVKSVLGVNGVSRLKAERELDTSYSLKNGVRLRVNCHFERGNMSLVARIIPMEIPTFEDLGMSETIIDLCDLHEGLILFTGPTGAGKSTSLAAMIKYISDERAVNIMTLEDPIEFLFEKSTGAIRQRQFGEDFLSFPEALKRVLRQDPDIVMVGEMRDLETIQAAMTLAETGHLIFATLHTPNTAQTVDRLVDVFPPHQQQQIRVQLSMSLRAVVSQRLLPREGGGRVAQREVLINTPAVSNIIRENRIQEMNSVLQTGRDSGMVSFEQDAKRLYKEGVISEDVYDWAVEGA